MPEAVFVEPSTGRRYPAQQAPYLGVEALWNQHNYWVCTQMPEPHSDSRAVPAQLALDLSAPDNWEALLRDPSSMAVSPVAGSL